jgi:hypothetical protein
MLDLQAETIELPDQLERRSGASADDADGGGEFPSNRFFFEGLQNTNPDGGNSARYAHTLIDHQIQKTFRVHVRAGKHQARS